MGEFMNHVSERPKQVAAMVLSRYADITEAKSQYVCIDIKEKTVKIEELLQQISLVRTNYQRPIRLAMDEVERVLVDALYFVDESCSDAHRIEVPLAVSICTEEPNFEKILSELEVCILNLRWLLEVFLVNDGRAYLAVAPPMANGVREVVFLWSYLRLMLDGNEEEQKMAAISIGKLGSDSGDLERIEDEGVLSVFAEILKEGPMRVQAEVAWAVSELAAISLKFAELCGQSDIIGLLIKHLVFEAEHVFLPTNKATSVLAFVMARDHSRERIDDGDDDQKNRIQPPRFEDREIKSYMKAMAARAIWRLVKSNSSICRMVCKSKVLMSFAFLLETGTENVQYHSAMALKEITAIAEQESELRRSVFIPNSPVWKAIVDALFKVVKKYTSTTPIVPCINTMGNLAGTFRSADRKIIPLLVKLLDRSNSDVATETLLALSKFVCRENHLHTNHSKVIISTGGVEPLMRLVDLGGSRRTSALVVLRYIVTDVPDSQELERANVFNVL